MLRKRLRIMISAEPMRVSLVGIRAIGVRITVVVMAFAIALIFLMRDHGADHADREGSECGTMAVAAMTHVNDVARHRFLHRELTAGERSGARSSYKSAA